MYVPSGARYREFLPHASMCQENIFLPSWESFPGSTCKKRSCSLLTNWPMLSSPRNRPRPGTNRHQVSKSETVIIALKHGSIDVICDEGHSLFFFRSLPTKKRRSMVHVAQPMDKERDTEIVSNFWWKWFTSLRDFNHVSSDPNTRWLIIHIANS